VATAVVSKLGSIGADDGFTPVGTVSFEGEVGVGADLGQAVARCVVAEAGGAGVGVDRWCGCGYLWLGR